MKVPYVDIAGQFARDRDGLMPAIEAVLSGGQHVNAAIVEELETKLAAYHQAAECICLNSGTDALVLCLEAYGIGPGDEVITQSNSFVASAAAIVRIGARPIFADVLDDQSIDPAEVERSITERTKAIMPVHLTGRIGDMAAIQSIAARHDLLIIEDAAQSIGSTWRGRLSGTLGAAGCFSAHPLKNLGACGDAGFVITDDQEVARKIRLLRNHGLATRAEVSLWGTVSRMDALQAAILLHRLSNLDQVLAARSANAALYRERLNPDFVYFPTPRNDAFDSYHTFVIQTDRRDELQTFLSDKGVGSAIHYPIPLHQQPAAKDLGYGAGSLPVVEQQAARILTLPVHELLTEAQIGYVVESVNGFFEGQAC